MRHILTGSCLYLFCIFLAGPALCDGEFDVGGPLQGVSLPPYPTQQGEKPGYPGVIPGLVLKDAAGNPVTVTSEGLPPERQLYEGSVEHFRAYFFKYLPVKSFFDRQSLRMNWLASDLAPNRTEEYAEPVYWVPRHAPPLDTGRRNKPVKVVRCKPASPAFQLDCGTLPAGLYAIRAIGAVEAKDLVRHRKPLVLRLTVNDGLKGEESTYRFRCKYVDEFYALAEFYFHAPETRAYKATLSVEPESLVEPLLYNIDLHDALAGSTDRALKTKMTLAQAPAALPALPPYDEARLARDAELWQALPPLNAHKAFCYGTASGDPEDKPINGPRLGAGGLSAEQIREQYGEWTAAPVGPVLMVNEKLKLAYSVADLASGKPLPDPYPFKDYGAGVYTPSAQAGEPGQNWVPVAKAALARFQNTIDAIRRGAPAFLNGDVATGRDAAILLCALAYYFPSHDSSSDLAAILVQPGPHGRDMGCRQRDPQQFQEAEVVLESYDQLFELMKTDAGLARSIGRFVPWVKTPQDVIRLVDVYLVQTLAKRRLRYHYYNTNNPAKILNPLLVLGDTTGVTAPWMNWLFSSAFIYPQAVTGVQDLLVTGNDRDGIGPSGSYYYSMGQQAAPSATILEGYITAGGDARYDLRDPRRYPKPLASCYWMLDTRMAGLYWPRIGDVTGPDKVYDHWFENVIDQARLGWRWTRDPRFAYVLKNYGGRKTESETEWHALETAAAACKRAPWLDARSRIVSGWLGLLEAGITSDDPRARRDVFLRLGIGVGHAHSDTLDLQGHAHGYPFTVDGGQRGGYSAPGDRLSRVHNVVEVDGQGWQGHSWATALTEVEGARYLAGEAAPLPSHPGVTLYRRQVALIDADETVATKPFTPEQAGPAAANLPSLPATPNSYIFDVVRVAGGKVHTYCFHGPLEDELIHNGRDMVAGVDRMADKADQEYLSIFPDKPTSAAGKAPAIVEATWRLTREATIPGVALPIGPVGTEPALFPAIYDEKSPRKYTRLHLLGHEGARMLTARSICNQWKYAFTQLMVQDRKTADGEVVFPAVIEPFAGTPFIRGLSLVSIPGNVKDARAAVAVKVKTTNGRDDLLFSDGRPGTVREVDGGRLAAEFACVSTDANGLRLATLTGGTMLETPLVALRPAKGERIGTIKTCSYFEKRFMLAAGWPEAALLAGRVCEIGTENRKGSYTIAGSKPDGSVTVTGGADYVLTRVRSVDPEKRQIRCTLGLPFVTREDPNPFPGISRQFAASNEEGTKFWRADYLGIDPETSDYLFQLDGAATEADFGALRGFRLWEYGRGDTVRQSTFAALRRVEPGVFELEADIETVVALKGSSLEVSPDRQNWKTLAAKSVGGKVEAAITLADLGSGGRVFLRVR